MDNWDHYRTILAIARGGGLTAAAQTLGLAHATVSRRLAAAEARMGARLFDRFQTGLTPTEAGREAAARAEAMEAEAARMGRWLAAEAGAAGPLALTAPPLLMATHLASDLTEFARAHPRISLSVLGDNRVFNLHRREADLALRVTRSPDESLWGRKLTDQRAAWFAAPAFLRVWGEALAQARTDLEVPLIGFTHWPAPLPRRLAERAPRARVAAMCDDMPTAQALVRQGLGMTRMPIFVGRSDPGLRQITALPNEDYPPIWLLTHPDLRRAATVRLLMDWLAERVSAQRRLYLGD